VTMENLPVGGSLDFDLCIACQTCSSTDKGLTLETSAL